MRAALSVVADAAVDWWQHWLPLTLLNLLWVAAWLSVVLGPPVTLAVHAYLGRLLDHDQMTPAEFARTVRDVFWQGWAWAVAALAPVFALAVALVFYARFPGPWARAAELSATLVVLCWLLVQSFALPFLVTQQRRSLRLAYRNAALTLLASPLHAAVFALVVVILAVLSLRFMALTFLVSPVLLAMIATHAVRERLSSFGLLEAGR